MAGDGGRYTTWRGLTDRTISGRQLPPTAPEYTKSLPPLDDIMALFQRPSGKTKLASRTTLLLPMFAQWFTDGFLRTKWKPPTEQDYVENESTHQIDLNQIYGATEVQTNILRAKKGGKLRSQMIKGEEYPEYLFDTETLQIKPEFEGLYSDVNFTRVFQNVSDEQKKVTFAVGLEHGNSTVANTIMNTLFLREHNRLAGIIEAAHKDWDDERIFQTTRNCLIVILMKIVINDYVAHIADAPVFLDAGGFAEDQPWYRENWMSVEFNLLYRWHDMIPDQVSFTSADQVSFSSEDEYWDMESSKTLVNNNTLMLELGVEQILLDASKQRAGQLGLFNTPDFLLHVHKETMKQCRMINLAPYVDYCKEYGLTVPKTFRELTGGNLEYAKALESVYDSVEHVEWFVGLWAGGKALGQFSSDLLILMVGHDAVTQLFTNPLLSRRVYNAETFSQEGLQIIESTERLADLVVRNTNVADSLQIRFGV